MQVFLVDMIWNQPKIPLDSKIASDSAKDSMIPQDSNGSGDSHDSE